MGAADQTLGYRITGDASGLDAAIASTRKNVADLTAETVSSNKTLSDSAIEALRQQSNLSAAQYKSAADAKTASAAIGDQTSALTALIGKIDPTVAKLGALDSQLEQLKKFKSSGAISGEDFAAYAGKIELTREAINDASAAESVLTLNTSNTRREFGLFIKDILSGNFGQAQRELGTLAGATGIVQLAFTAAGAAVIGTLAVIGAAIALFVSAENQIDGFNRQLLLTGNYAGQTAQGLGQLTTEIGAATGHYGEASEALTKLAGNGRIAGEQLRDAAQGSIAFATLTGESIDKAVGEFEKIAKDPVAAIAELNSKYNFLTAAQAIEIIQLADEGQKTAAAALETKLFSQALTGRADAYKAGQGAIVKAWDEITTAIGKALDQSNKFFQRAGSSGLSLADFTPTGLGNLAAKLINGVIAPANGGGTELQQGAANLASANAAAAGEATRADADLSDAVQKLTPKLDAETNSLKEQTAALGKGKAAALAFQEQQEVDRLSVGKSTAEIANIKSALDTIYGPAIKAAQGFDAQTASQKAAAEAARKLQQEEQALPGLELQVVSAIEQLNASQSKEATLLKEKLTQQTLANKLIQIATDLYKAGKIGIEEYNTDVDASNALSAAAAKHYADEAASLTILNRIRRDDGDAVQQLLARYKEEEDALTDLGKAHSLETQELQAERDMQHAIEAAATAGDLVRKQQLLSELDGLKQRARGHADYMATLQQERSLIGDWAQTAEQDFGQAFQAINKDIIEGGSVMKDLVDLAKQVVEQIIFEFEKLAIINPILNSVFGGTRPDLGTAQGALGLLLNNASSGGAAASGGGFNLFSPSSWIDAGKNLASGFSNFAFGGASNAIDEAGTLQYAPSAAGASTGFFNSSLADQIGGANGSWGGAVGSVLGGAFGGYELGKQLFGSTVGGVVTGAAAATAAYFVPVVGWAFAAASLINSLTGGNVFGTDYKPTGQTSQEITVGAGGSTVQDFYQEHKHGALFSSGKYKDVSTPASQDQLDALSQFDKQLDQVRTSAADALGVTVADVITGAFNQAFDKNGKVITQTSTVLGQVYNESSTDFQARELADNLIAQVNKALGTDEASQIAAKYQSNAQTLYDAAQLLVAAEVDVKNGTSLLGDDKSLTDISGEVAKLNVSGESLVQTYVRLQTETIDVQSTLDQLGLTTSKTGTSFVEFSDDMVKAAGSLDNLNTLWSDYFANYYSSSEQAAAKLKVDQANESKLFAAIGQDPNESMAQFRAAFTSVFDTLSPEDVVKWLQAGEALAVVNADLGTTANQAQAAAQQYAAFIQPFRDMVDGVTNFESAVRSMGDSVSAAIAQANALAQAQGLQGASAEGVATIIKTFAIQGANALLQLQQETQQLASKLYGADYLQSLYDDYKKTGNVFDISKIQDAQGAQVKQQDNSRYLDAFQLANNAAQISAFTGENIDDVLKELGVPLGALGTDLKLNGQSTEDYLSKLVDQAKINEGILNASDITNKLLQDILDQARGAPLTYTKQSDFGQTDPNTAQTAAPGGKPGARTATGPITVTPQPARGAPATPPPANGRGGDDGGDVGKQIGRVGDAVSGIPAALANNGSDVAAAIDRNTAAIVQNTAAVNRWGMQQKTDRAFS